jgi:hypothetical protein
MYKQAQIDEALEWKEDYDVVFAFALLIVQETTKNNRQYPDLTFVERLPILVNSLDSQVWNGGFHQFFFNSSGDFALDTLKTLYRIGANSHASLLEKAIAIFQHPYPVGHSERTKMLKMFSSELLADLKELSETYFSLPDTPYHKTVLFLRSHCQELSSPSK